MLNIEESVSGCALCQTVITTVEDMLEDPKNEHKVDEILDKVCNYVPRSVHEKVRIYWFKFHDFEILDILMKNFKIPKNNLEMVILKK